MPFPASCSPRRRTVRRPGRPDPARTAGGACARWRSPGTRFRGWTKPEVDHARRLVAAGTRFHAPGGHDRRGTPAGRRSDQAPPINDRASARPHDEIVKIAAHFESTRLLDPADLHRLEAGCSDQPLDLLRRHGRRRLRRRAPPAPVTGCRRIRNDRPTCFRMPWPRLPGRRPPGYGPAGGLPFGRRRGDLALPVDADRVARDDHEACRLWNRQFRPGHSPVRETEARGRRRRRPAMRLRLSTATDPARTDLCRQPLADPLSELESRRVSPPEASWRAMADPIPPVPITATVMTEASSLAVPITPHRRRYSDFTDCDGYSDFSQSTTSRLTSSALSCWIQ